MQPIDLIYYTPDYPKLVETVARQCYQSFDKVSETSHRFIRSIMSKGHLSVASVGNIVFGLPEYDERLLLDLMKMKEINNFIRWSITPENKYAIIVSMNMLTFLDIKNAGGNALFAEFLQLTDEVPMLAWFYNREVELEPSANCYIEKSTPSLYKPTMLSEDYNSLKQAGLTAEELFVHATITIDYMTDRSTGLQLWRHGDMTGGTELSQRYVNRGEAVYRELIGFEGDARVEKLLNEAIQHYNSLIEELTAEGVHLSRAKEVARAILPNAIVTQIIQCRPLRQWQHLFNLRDSSHAQKEAAADTRTIKQLFLDHQIDIK